MAGLSAELVLWKGFRDVRHRWGNRSDGSARVSRVPAAGDDRRDRAPRAGRRTDPHRAGRGAGARRLSIVDLAGGRQPICNEDGSIWVTQNGELFEYPELQAELARARPSPGDAVRHRALGPPLRGPAARGCSRKARGQFAVALWDRKTRTLILGRDRVGICPLYYAEVDGWLLWGSEIKALLSSGMVARAARPEGDRPLLQHVLRRDDADVLRGDHVDPARPLPAGSRRPGRAEDSTGTSTSPTRARSAGSTIRRRWSTSSST